MELLGFLTIGLALVVYSAKGEIRCVCNEPSCVSTGYMCKSNLDGCFSQLTFDVLPKKTQHARHGCVEALSEQDRNLCDFQGSFVESENENWPILMCCKDDMCNYLDLEDMAVEDPRRSTPRTSNGSSKGPESHYRDPLEPVQRPDYNYLEEKDLWFKAAVIAVPIAGGFILILLVLLAIRMLRNDSRRHRQLMQVRHRSLAKAQLYVTDHFCKRDPEKCPRLMTGHANPYSDVNIKINPHDSSQGYEKIRPASDSSVQEGSVNSVVTWGSKPERATNV